MFLVTLMEDEKDLNRSVKKVEQFSITVTIIVVLIAKVTEDPVVYWV